MEAMMATQMVMDVIEGAHTQVNAWWLDDCGEEGGDNQGPFIDSELGARGRRWSWCALLVREAYRRQLVPRYTAAGLVEAHPWLWRIPPRRLHQSVNWTSGTPEPGALRLLTGMAEVGSRYTDPDKAIPGDAILYKRRRGHHAKMVHAVEPHGIIATLEGNVGRPPAPIKQLSCDPLRDPNFMFFATLRRGVK